MKKKKNRGYSLVELLIAMVILSLIMVSIASFASSTTSTYVRTKADAELQQDGVQVLDMLSDKIMQAKVVRIGVGDTDTSGKVIDCTEYCSASDHLCGYVDASGKMMLDEHTPLTGSTGGDAYVFNELDESAIVPGVAGKNLQYIAVLYDTVMTDTTHYKYMLDIYRFTDNEIHLYRFSGSERFSAQQTTADPAEVDPSEATLDHWMDGWINSVASQDSSFMEASKDDHLICSTVEKADLYASPADNSIFIKIDLKNERKRAENSVQSMITIRNNYVLQPKGF